MKLARMLSLGSLAFSALLFAWDQSDSPEIKSIITASEKLFTFESVQCPETQNPADPIYAYRVAGISSINDAGVIAGSATSNLKGIASQAFVYSNVKFTILSAPLSRGRYSAAVHVNNRGQLLLVQAPGQYFLYDIAQGTFSPVSPFVHVAGGPPRLRAEVVGMNDQGVFVGNFSLAGKPVAGFGQLATGAPGSLAAPDQISEFTVIACPNNMPVVAKAINNRGQITGSCGPLNQSRGFVYTNGQVATFSYPDSLSTTGNAINDGGVVAGVFVVRSPQGGAEGNQGFVYDGAQFAPIARTHPASTSRTTADGINNIGQIVGVGAGEGFLAKATQANALLLSGRHQ